VRWRVVLGRGMRCISLILRRLAGGLESFWWTAIPFSSLQLLDTLRMMKRRMT
jgi:hypothetical protein